jgi:dTDP-4-dehydrorhamnose reductase
MNILVFGKDGQLGKAFKSLLGDLSLAKDAVTRYVGRADCDLSDEFAINNLLEQFAPDLIINAAAYTAVDKAETEIALAYAVNARAPELMAIYAAKQGATLLHYSTDYVFDGRKEGSYSESDICTPLGIYGKSKLAGEIAIKNALKDSRTGQYAILRTSWVYGEGANFIRTILRLAKERDQLRVIHDQYGVPTNAAWLARVGLDLTLNQDLQLKKLTSGIYNAVPSGETTWHGLAKLVIQTALDCGVVLKVESNSVVPILAVEYPLPAPRPQNSRLDNSKLHLLMGRESDVTKLQYLNISWEDDVRKYVRKLAQDGLI